MKIVKDKAATKTFGDVPAGSAFGYSGNVYIKAVNAEFANYNSVRLNDGAFGDFQNKTPVAYYPKAFVTTGEEGQ